MKTKILLLVLTIVAGVHLKLLTSKPLKPQSGLNHATVGWVSTPQFDFYYSPKQTDTYIKDNTSSAPQYYKYAFRGKPYTECVKKGSKLICGFDDFKLVGTGTMNEVQQIGIWW